MSRDAEGKASGLASTEADMGQKSEANAAALYPQLTSQAQELLKSPGYDPATLSAITNAGMGGVNAAYGSAGGAIQRNAARTNNAASVAPQLDTLARQKGEAGGVEAGNIQIANQGEKDAQRQQGLNILGSLYGTNNSTALNAYGAATGATNVENTAAGNPYQDFNQVLTGVGSLVKPITKSS